MISKPEILLIATATGLLPSTIEKDYVLSWLLHAISKHELLSKWVFKGGTCLKKCYFETYRFSEDLDFTVPFGAIYETEKIQAALVEIAHQVYDETGITIPTESIEVKESFNKNNARTYEVKFGYIGPLNFKVKALPRIKFDLTNDEIITDEINLRPVFHPYSDAPGLAAQVQCYSINEILAEKTRALFERQGRARDVYDIVNIGRNFRSDIDMQKARRSLLQKFAFKGLPSPSVEVILEAIDLEILKSNWNGQLSHQLLVLPPVEAFFRDLASELMWWMNEVAIEAQPAALKINSDDIIVPKVHFTYSSPGRLGIGKIGSVGKWDFEVAADLDKIRFAARNRLLVSFEYSGATRLVEPYSLRRPKTGNLLLYVVEVKKDSLPGKGVCSFKINSLSNVEISQTAFSPRYLIEL